MLSIASFCSPALFRSGARHMVETTAVSSPARPSVRCLEGARADGHAVECFPERASIVGLMCLIHLVDKTIIRHGIDDEVLHVERVITSLSMMSLRVRHSLVAAPSWWARCAARLGSKGFGGARRCPRRSGLVHLARAHLVQHGGDMT